MIKLLLIAVLGAFGAVSRYLVTGWVHALAGDAFPYGTLAVNVCGCFLLGFVAHVGLTTEAISPNMRGGLAFGFLGALTTFSTFGYDTLHQLEEGQWGAAMANIAANVLLGLLAVWAGIVLARALVGGA